MNQFRVFTTEALESALDLGGSKLNAKTRQALRDELTRRMSRIAQVLHDDTVRSTKKGFKR